MLYLLFVLQFVVSVESLNLRRGRFFGNDSYFNDHFLISLDYTIGLLCFNFWPEFSLQPGKTSIILN